MDGGHAKVLAIYLRPFWRERGLSGTVSSFVGPLAEIHDASALDGGAALFGFVGLGALDRQVMIPEELITASLAQFARLFGQEALEPAATYALDWAQEPLTATAADAQSVNGQPPLSRRSMEALLKLNVIASGTETAVEHRGYLEGAVEAAEYALHAYFGDKR